MSAEYKEDTGTACPGTYIPLNGPSFEPNDYDSEGNSVQAVKPINAEMEGKLYICPRCGKYLQTIKKYSSIVFPNSPPFYRIICECGWYSNNTFTRERESDGYEYI